MKLLRRYQRHLAALLTVVLLASNFSSVPVALAQSSFAPVTQTDEQPEVDANQETVEQPEGETNQETDEQPEVDVNQETDEQPEVDANQETDEQPEVDVNQETDEQPEVDVNQETDEQPKMDANQETTEKPESKEEGAETAPLTIYLNRKDANYEGWNVYSWFNGNASVDFTAHDENWVKATIDVPLNETVEYIIRQSLPENEWANKNHADDQKITISEATDVWVTDGLNGYYTSEPNLEFAPLTIYFNRNDANYEGWNVYSWFNGTESVDFVPYDEDWMRATIDVPVGEEVEYILRQSLPDNEWANKNHANNQKVTVDAQKEIWVTQGQDGHHTEKPDLNVADKPDLNLIVHYDRIKDDYENWAVHAWNTGGEDGSQFAVSQDKYGAVYSLELSDLDQAEALGFKLNGHNWTVADGGDRKLDVSKLQVIENADEVVAHVYLKEGTEEIFYNDPTKEVEDYSTVTIHYTRSDNDYTGWNLWLWGTDSDAKDRFDFQYKDENSYIAEFEVKTGNKIGYIIRQSLPGNDWANKNFDGDQSLVVTGDTEIWIGEGQNGFTPYGLGGDREELPEVYYEDPVSDEEAELQVFIHYYRYMEDYRTWNVWGWPEGGDGIAYSFKADQVDDYGRYAVINIADADAVDRLGFMVRRGEWSEKDIESDRFIDLSNPVLNKETGKLEVHAYILQDEAEVYLTDDVDKTPPLTNVRFTDMKTIKVDSPVLFETLTKNQMTKMLDGMTVKNEAGDKVAIETVTLSKDKETIEVSLKNDITMGDSYYVSRVGFKEPVYVEYYGLFDSKEFEEAFTYTGKDLGATYADSKTDFRVWAPTASKVTLKLYEDGHTESHLEDVEMTKAENGTWTARVAKDLANVYYTYEVTVGDETNEAVDPYARAVGVNGLRAMVVNLDETDPSNWEQDVNPEFSGNMTDAILYELHMRDLSTSETSGIDHVGKYLQFTETGTENAAGHSTGLDHLVEMGITHLHILPTFDHRSIDETSLEDNDFNWGYDPQNYNVPEGSYSTDPYNGDVRINEFKQMVQSLHENDIRVVMDVVYNHTGATADSDFNKIVPGYYYRQDADGNFANGSGCGNETASERAMMRKFMVDSVTYWAEEYNINGFRFDLMALHDIETMNLIVETLEDIDPTIIVYGEGWVGGGSPLPNEEAAYKGNASLTPDIAYFNDDMRDAVKGEVANATTGGYINSDKYADFYERLQFGIVGSTDHDQVEGWKPWATSPEQSISYVAAHDNNTLYDKLLGVQQTTGGDTSNEYIEKLQRQANAMVLTGQGVPFLHAGIEMLRSKDGDHNSYTSSDEINQIDWDLKTEYIETVEYHQGLIDLRLAHPAFRMMTTEDVQENLVFDESTSKDVMSFTLNNHANGDSVETIAVFHNVSNEVKIADLPVDGKWSVVVNGEQAGTDELALIDGASVELQPHSSYVLMLNYTEPVDVTAPVISLYGEREMTLTVGDEYVELGARAVDAVDGVLEVEISGDVNTSVAGTYIVSYQAQDEAQNTSTVTRTVTVVAEDIEDPDTEKPDIEDPDTEKPDVEDPDTEKPETEDPDTEKPETGINRLVIVLSGTTLGVIGFIFEMKRRKSL